MIGVMTKKIVALAALAAAVIALSGCANGGSELKEGMVAESQEDWMGAEASYSASVMAGNGEACKQYYLLSQTPDAQSQVGNETANGAQRAGVGFCGIRDEEKQGVVFFPLCAVLPSKENQFICKAGA